jgi:pyruvate dehydrogenase E2 component (dihydrolipoamide acetyltransferase)
MEEGTFMEWLKQDGDAIKEGDPIFILESDKAAQEVESTDSGILRIPPDAPKPGDVVKVGQLLGYLLAEGETMPAAAAPAVPTPPPRVETAAPISDPIAKPMVKSITKPMPEVTPASPRARRAARERRVDLSTLQPTGKGGRIRERDVLTAEPSFRDTTASENTEPMREVPVTALRRTIAERMMNSLRNTAPVTLTCRCDAAHLVALRHQLKAAGTDAIVPSYNDVIAKLVATALRSHPMLAGRWDGDRILLPEAIHIGIAVDTEHGLLVPVIRDVSELSLFEVARQSRSLIDATRTRRLKSEDMQGGCFTLSNLGSFGIEAFTPIINYPETAVLGLGAILRQPAVLEDGQLGVREQMTLSLTFDHRVVDGAPAARFLQTVRQGIENPVASLLGS